MKISIKKEIINKQYSNKKTQVQFNYELKEFVGKDVFKQIMELVRENNGQKEGNKKGYFLIDADRNDFLNELERWFEAINNSDYVAKKEVKKEVKITFQDFCEDNLDLDVDLMNDIEIKDAYKQYQNYI